MCRVGFLPKHMVKYSGIYDGALAQITEVYSPESESKTKKRKWHQNKGCCTAAIISNLPNGPHVRTPIDDDDSDSSDSDSTLDGTTGNEPNKKRKK